jgi:nitroreductase
MMEKAEVFDNIVNERRAMRYYDPEVKMPEYVVANSMKRAILSPSSSNMMLYEFYRVTKKDDLEKLTEYCLGQATAKTAHEMLVIVVRGDKYKQRAAFNYKALNELYKDNNPKRLALVSKYYSKIMPMYYNTGFFGLWGRLKQLIIWVTGLFRPMVRIVSNCDIKTVMHKSAALAAQTFMLSVQAEGFDTCPMEGVDQLRIKRWLKLPRKAEINMVISVGPGMLPKGIYNPRIRPSDEEMIINL